MPPKKRTKIGRKRKYHYVKTRTDHKDEETSPTASETEEIVETGTAEYDHEDEVTNTYPEVMCVEETVETSIIGTQPAFNSDHSYSHKPNDMHCLAEESTPEQIVEVLDTNSSDSLESHEKTVYEKLKDQVQQLSIKPYVLKTDSDVIQFAEFYESDAGLAVKWTISFQEDCQARIFVHKLEVSRDHEFWDGLPKYFNTIKDVTDLLNKLQSFSVCCGNPDEDYQTLIPVGAGLSDNKSPGILAYREGDFQACKGDLKYSSTIRTVNCKVLVRGSRCSCCSKYRGNLRRRKARYDERKAQPVPNYINSKYKHKDMDRDLLLTKLEQQKMHIKCLQTELNKTRRDIKQNIQQQGVILHDMQSEEMKLLMSVCRDDIEKSYPDPNCYQRLFWEQQVKNSMDGAQGMRWHPMIIRWCLHLRHKSPKAYDALRDSGFINLPSSRTLFDFSHYTSSALGYQADVVRMLKEECDKLGMYNSAESWKQYLGILFDEIKIKSDLVYDKHTGELIGYVDLDKVGNQIMEFEKFQSANYKNIAKFMLVVMVRGLTTNLRFPLAAFATTSISADLLYPIIWDAVNILEGKLHLKVLFVTCDGASANRRFFNLHKVNNDDLVYFTKNPYDDSRNLYFISDVPHLMKTARNCFANSFSHRNTRHLWKNGKDISWLHILRLFEEHCEFGLYTPCPKLSRAHVDLTAFSCMKVNLAAQVLSDSVANALEMLYGDCVTETVNFLRKMNKFFDCLNVKTLFEGRNKRNPDLDPYTSANDGRLIWLQQDFLHYFSEWNDSIQNRVGNFTKKDRSGMLLSHQTITGLKISVSSIVECIQYVLQKGAPFVLSHKFNQDPLEQHFAHYRHKGGANSNPTVQDVRNMLTKIRAVGTQALPPLQNGNIQRWCDNTVRIIDNTPLKRRKSNQ